jgi:hypothetical protein
MGSEHLAKMLSKVNQKQFLASFDWNVRFSFLCKSCFSSFRWLKSYCFLSQHLETVIKSKIPGIQSLISKTINEIETELTRLGKPVAADAGVSLLLFSQPV